MASLEQLAEMGQAVWLDYIRRAFITSGELAGLVQQGLRGVTSNPSIFEKAIAGSVDYDDALHPLAEAGQGVEQIYELLAVEDIRMAADVLRPVYDRNEGADGYVSLEVNPRLAHDTAGTVAEAHRLYAALDRPNVMIKVPATPEGIPAIATLIGDGISVNVTLLFALDLYEQVAEAYLAGLERLAASGGDLQRVASVASFFVSRVDTQVDRELEALGETDLAGKIAIANAKIAYRRFQEIFHGPRWEALTGRGARPQRLLWASTSTKNPAYPDTLYVDNLIGFNTVNTLPPATLQAFLDHGRVANTLESGVEEAAAQLARLAQVGIDLDAITDRLLDDGLQAFARSFDTMLSSIAEKREKLLAGWLHQEAALGPYQEVVTAALEAMAQQRTLARIWARDHTVWSPDPDEITNRLGWLDIADRMSGQVGRMEALREAARAAGYTHALLLGMGGSSLAPQVFRNTFGVVADGLDLKVLDSTDPAAVLAFDQELDLARTLFIVATKSGGTVETLSFFKYFYNRVVETAGEAHAGDHFVAITDPGSRLADLAARYQFRDTFLNDPNIGGRYSALSYFGLVPAALIGMDVGRLLERAMAMGCGCESCVGVQDNPGAWLGAMLGELAQAGRDKVTLAASPAIASFGDWVEQLIAESTGKSGRGILPVVGEPLGSPPVYAADRLFVHLRRQDDETFDEAIQALEAAGHPVVRLHLHDRYDLGGQFFLWELATAVAGARLGIHPFNQPNVEAAKVLARQMVAAYQQEGRLPVLDSTLEADGIQVFGEVTATTPAEALLAFLATAHPGDPETGAGRSYVALQAYLPPTGENAEALQGLRLAIRDRYRLATSLGFGPRFLHSTGQLHKGDAGHGLFIQFTVDDPQDVPIPDEAGEQSSSISFGVLKAAQALGDRQALLDAGRRVIRFHLGTDPVVGLQTLSRALA